MLLVIPDIYNLQRTDQRNIILLYGKQSLEKNCHVKRSCHNTQDYYAVAVKRNGVIIGHLPSLGLKKFKVNIFVKQLQLELTRIHMYRYIML